MSFTQDTFIAIINIVIIDIILGGDNAVVIALACRRLPENRRNKAIILGTGLAVILRIFLTVVTVTLLKIPFLLLIGGLLLLFIAYKLIANQDEDMTIKAGNTLWSAIRTIVVADLVMGLDNILGIAGASNGRIELVILGLCISVPIIIWGSKIILIAMDHIPGLIYIGGGVLAYTASKMIWGEPTVEQWLDGHLTLKSILTLSMILGVLILGWFKNYLGTRTSNPS
jgi:YjbE family integral membrane protein